jgi:hypothetical protein
VYGCETGCIKFEEALRRSNLIMAYIVNTITFLCGMASKDDEFERLRRLMGTMGDHASPLM